MRISNLYLHTKMWMNFTSMAQRKRSQIPRQAELIFDDINQESVCLGEVMTGRGKLRGLLGCGPCSVFCMGWRGSCCGRRRCGTWGA